MPRFTDGDGREWIVEIDPPLALRVRQECDPQFLIGDERREDNTFQRLDDDPVLLCRVLYVLCAKQRMDRGLSEEDFYLKVLRDSIEQAAEALADAIIFFIPPKTREVLLSIRGKQNEVMELVRKMAIERANDPELMERVKEKINEAMESPKPIASPGS